MAQDQVLCARRRADGVELHEAQRANRCFQITKRKERARNRVGAELADSRFSGHRLRLTTEAQSTQRKTSGSIPSVVSVSLCCAVLASFTPPATHRRWRASPHAPR